MPTGSYTENFEVDGASMTRRVSKTADACGKYGDAAAPITLAAGKTVTSWVKTDADTAECDLPGGHGYANGKFDVYLSDGTLVRYGVDGTIATNALTLDGGTVAPGGSGFPESATVGVIVCKQQQINAPIDGDMAKMVGISATAIGHADFQDASSASIRAISLQPSEMAGWDDEKAGANPYTGNPITKVLVSNGSTTAGTVTILVLQDSTP